MYELYQALGNSYYIQSPAKIGLVRLDDSRVCLIDSGNDKDAGPMPTITGATGTCSSRPAAGSMPQA